MEGTRILKLGIIGTGIIAREHARAISMLQSSAEIVAASDVDRERLNDFCGLFRVPVRYKDSADLIANPDVSLVVITTPPPAHEPLVVSALNAGKYVFCEKPLAHSLASALRIAEAASHHPGRCTVSHQLRYDPAFKRLMWLCRNGWIGDIQSAVIERHSYIPHFNQCRSDWWGSWEIAGGGVLITQLIHELDLLLLIMGRPTSVSADVDTRYTKIESEDYLETTIRFASGATARCVASVNSGRFGGEFSIRGTSGTVGLPWKFTTTLPGQISRAIKELDQALPDTRPVSSSLLTRGSRIFLREIGVKPKEPLTSHAQLYKEIAKSIHQRRPLPISPAEALGPLELCFAAYCSAITGKEVAIPLTSNGTVYCGITKELYEARKCSRRMAQPTFSRTVKNDKNRAVVRVGLIGLDTSHATTFTSILHNANDPFHIPGAKVVAAYPGGSPDMPVSISRVAGFTSELKNRYGVRITDSPEDVAENSDLIFILSSDGRTHPGLFRSVASYGRPVFLDKPVAVSTADAAVIYAVAREAGVRVFASSAFRYADSLVSALNSIRALGERVKTCRVRYWLQIQETQGRYFWYGIHGAEMLLTIMGCGVQEVEASSNAGEDRITVWHNNGRRSSIAGSTVDETFGVTVETDKRMLHVDLTSSMASLSARILWAALDVLTEGQYPRLWSATTAGSVSGPRLGRVFDPNSSETLEVVRLLDAAQRSYAVQQRLAI